jgi:hypothetical protein
MTGGVKGQTADIHDQCEDDVGENGHLHESDVGVADDRQSTADLAEEQSARDAGREPYDDLT